MRNSFRGNSKSRGKFVPLALNIQSRSMKLLYAVLLGSAEVAGVKSWFYDWLSRHFTKAKKGRRAGDEVDGRKAAEQLNVVAIYNDLFLPKQQAGSDDVEQQKPFSSKRLARAANHINNLPVLDRFNASSFNKAKDVLLDMDITTADGKKKLRNFVSFFGKGGYQTRAQLQLVKICGSGFMSKTVTVKMGDTVSVVKETIANAQNPAVSPALVKLYVRKQKGAMSGNSDRNEVQGANDPLSIVSERNDNSKTFEYEIKDAISYIIELEKDLGNAQSENEKLVKQLSSEPVRVELVDLMSSEIETLKERLKQALEAQQQAQKESKESSDKLRETAERHLQLLNKWRAGGQLSKALVTQIPELKASGYSQQAVAELQKKFDTCTMTLRVLNEQLVARRAEVLVSPLKGSIFVTLTGERGNMSFNTRPDANVGHLIKAAGVKSVTLTTKDGTRTLGDNESIASIPHTNSQLTLGYTE